MSFSPGRFDIVAQVETRALDVVVDVILKTLEARGKTRFTQQMGGGALGSQIDVELTDLGVPGIRSLDLNDRFKPGNTLATFQVDTELSFTVTVFGVSGQLTETLYVQLKDLAIGLYTTPGGLPVGVALGFEEFDIDAGGLSTLSGLNPVLNLVVDFIALGIRTALTPLGLVPIPLLQFADAFAQLGLFFDSPSPYLGTNQRGDGLYLVADFKAAGNSADIAVVEDIIPAGSPLNIAIVLSQRPVNQVLPPLLASNQLENKIHTAGADFRVSSAVVSFLAPGPRAAKVKLSAAASARIKERKGGFFGKLFGRRKKVTLRAHAEAVIDLAVVKDPQTQIARLEFAFSATLKAKVSIGSVLAGVLTVLLGPFLVIFLVAASQLLNFALKFFLPLKFAFDTDGVDLLTVRIDQLSTQLGFGGGLAAATLKIRLSAQGSGTLQLDHLTQHQIAASGTPIEVGYHSDSLATREEELFMGIELATP